MSLLLTDAPDICANDLVLSKEIADTLHAHYPGHLWGVTVQGVHGVADIRNLMLDARYGYRLKIVKEYSASNLKRRVILAGGEILERYKLDRGAYREDQVELIAHDRFGRAVGDISRNGATPLAQVKAAAQESRIIQLGAAR
jgi:hypothetical protein